MIVLSRKPIDTIAGFTLLEALISMALMATILAALATITRQWLPNWNKGIGRVQANEHISVGLEKLTADLTAAEFVLTGTDPRTVAFDGTDRSITFVRTSLGPNAGVGLDIVRITEIDTDKGPALVRTRAPFVPGTEGSSRQQQSFLDPVVLLRAPYRLSFAYAGLARSWQPTWRLHQQLPSAIKVTLQNTRAPDAPLVSTAIVVRANVPMDCIRAPSLSDCITSHLQPAKSTPAGKSPS